MATAKVEAPTDDEHQQVIDWYRDRLSQPAVFPWEGCGWEPVRIGPTWQTVDGRWLLPDASIGWDVLGWCGTELQLAGRPWRFTDEQSRFLLWWYAVDEAGRFLFRDGVLQRLKGWGKDPVGACLLYTEALGPCRVAYMDRDTPVATDNPSAWVQTAATSKDQTKNTMRLMPSLISPGAKSHYRVQVGKETVYALGDERFIQALTSSPSTIEGARSTFILKNEALALDTPIPTPNGWSTVGEVEPGDVIYGSSGRTTVTHTTPVYTGRPCYRVTFEDGQSLVADEGHLWRCKPTSSAAKPRTRTTREIVEDGRTFQVPLLEDVDDPPADLELDPYVLGYWLGDGDSRSAVITVGDEDLAGFRSEMGRRGITTTVSDDSRDGAPRVSLTIDGARRNWNDPRPLGVRGRLASIGVLGNKHVPGNYLRASRAQRLDLLRGLMDSDGCATGTSAVFVNQARELVDAVAELARSLGYRVGIHRTEDERYDPPIVGWRVQFRTDERINPFLMDRKASAVSGHRREWKSIRSVEPVDSVPVKCIEVDAPDHLFVAGRGWTLTHNTQHWTSSNAGHDMEAVIARNATKAPEGTARALAITNAPEPGRDSVAERAREAYDKSAAGQSMTRGILYDSLEADPSAPLAPDRGEDEPADVYEARTRAHLASIVPTVKGDSWWLDDKAIVDFVLDTRNPPSKSRRFWFNQITAAEDAWTTPQDWDALAAPEKLEDGAEVCLFFDGSKTDDATGLAAVRTDDGKLFTLNKWQRPPNVDEWSVPRAAVDDFVDHVHSRYSVVGFFADPGAGEDDSGERYWDRTIDGWGERYGAGYKVQAQAGGTKKHPILWDMRPPSRQEVFTHECERMLADIEASAKAQREGRERPFTHDGDPRMRDHVTNARRRPNGYGVSIGKEHRESSRKIDLAVCAVGARVVLRQFMTLPEKKRRKKSGKVSFL